MKGPAKELCFTKRLTEADVNKCLEISEAALHLPPRDEVMHVLDQNETVWRFKAPAKRRGKRSMTGQWLNFVKAASLKTGDILKYYRLAYENMYLVEYERQNLPHSDTFI